jgi:predicted acylesterase/phospholipase RssA
MPPLRRLGLALSGGGFRAAAFHLGVLRGLRETGCLERVSVISAVSGGALLAAAFVARGRADFAGFEAFMRSFLARDLKARVLLAAARPDRLLRLIWDPAYSLTEVLADVLDREVFGGATLGSLAGVEPRLVVNATCINHGTGFRFTPDRIGDWLLATEDRQALARFPLCRAVAASAAFPGGFAPLVLHGSEWFQGCARAPREVLLTDGGVDDNLGVQALVAAGCDALVVADGSFPFARDERPLDRFGLPAPRRACAVAACLGVAGWGAWTSTMPAWALAPALALLLLLGLRLRLALALFGEVMLRGQRRGLLRHAFARGKQRPVVYLGLASGLGSEARRSLDSRGVEPQRLRRLRTDLSLSRADVDALAALGEALARERVAAAAHVL